MIQQGRPYSFVSNFVHITQYKYRLERLPTNQIAFVNLSSLIGRYLQGLLDAD